GYVEQRGSEAGLPGSQPVARRYSGGIVFFFQAEDGIRDKLVTGVQTCALPIFPRRKAALEAGDWRRRRICGFTPSLGTARSARRRSAWFQRRVLTLGDRFWTVKQIARNSEHPAHSGAGLCPPRRRRLRPYARWPCAPPPAGPAR